MELRHKRDIIPGLVYGGPAQEKLLVQAHQNDVHELLRTRQASFNCTLVDLTVEDEYDPNGKERKKYVVVPRSIELHNLYEYPLSCNWMIYDPKRGLRVDVPIEVEDRDKCPGLKRGAVVNRVYYHIPCWIKGPTIIDKIVISVAGMRMGDRFRWSDIDFKQLPSGVTVQCTHFLKPSWTKAGIKDFTLLSIEGGKKAEEEDAKKGDEESLEKF